VRRLRLLLCLVDTEDNVKLLLELNKLAVVKGFTLLLAWTWQEAARYLETFKAYENKPPTSIQEKVRIACNCSLAVFCIASCILYSCYTLKVRTSNYYRAVLLTTSNYYQTHLQTQQVNTDYLAKVQDCLCSVPAVNKTDVLTLVSTFGSMQGVCEASMEEMTLCPGLGDKKVMNLYEALHSPFISTGRSTGTENDQLDNDNDGDAADAEESEV
jgi:DNA excision repair protein ERCC-1